MRSRIGLYLIFSTSAVIAAALASCRDQAANGNDGVSRSPMGASTAVTTIVNSRAAAADPHSAPVTDSLHFDLYCELRGRIVSNSDPEVVHGTYEANKPTWREHPHLIVDLQAMQICDACEEHGPSPIPSATSDRITLNDQPDITVFIRRRDWRFEERQDDMGRVSVITGRCVPGRFSGFPGGARPEAPDARH